MMRFEFATATRIIFGSGSVLEIGDIAAGLGSHAMVVIGANSLRASALLKYLEQAGVRWTIFNVVGEPTTQVAREGTTLARRSSCDMVIGFGGGSVIDAGKAIAALIQNPGDPLDYLEVIGRGQALTQPPVPYIAIPTTAGTGAEVTRNAVLGSPEHRVKVSLRSPLMLPRVALVDSDLTHSMPPPVTASTGLDALTQVLEPYVSHLATPLTDGFCLDGLHRATRSLRRVYHNGTDFDAREDMALVSLYGGLALANAKLGAVHGFAGPFGGMFDAPHGAVCAALLPHVMGANVDALKERQPDSEALMRYDEVAQVFTQSVNARR
jgi:alcohol dehydrogenase class IV